MVEVPGERGADDRRRVRLERDVAGVPGADPGRLRGAGRAPVEPVGRGVHGLVGPRGPGAGLPGVGGDEPGLRLGAHQQADVVEQRGSGRAPGADGDPGAAQRGARPTARDGGRGVAEPHAPCVVHVAVHERAEREPVGRRHQLEQPDGVERACLGGGAGVDRRHDVEHGEARAGREQPVRVGGRLLAERDGDRGERQEGVRPGERERHGRGACEPLHLVPRGRRFTHEVGAGGAHLRRRVERERPLPAGVEVGAQGGADARRVPPRDLVRGEEVVERCEAAGGDRLAEVRVVEHDQVVARAQVVDRVRLEALERLGVPGDQVAGRGGQCVVAAGVVPGEAPESSPAAHVVSTTTPSCSSCSISAASRPSSPSTSRVCSPVSGAPRSIRGGVAENLYGNPGTVTVPSVGWS